MFGIKDKNLHIILLGAIIVLASAVIYLGFFYSSSADPYEGLFASTISKFDVEHSLQEKAEEIKPGSVRAPILIYHSVRPHHPGESPLQKYYDVSPESFSREMQYLKDSGFTIIGLDYLADALEQNIELPPKPVVITFDDGWRSRYSYAFPILKKYGYTATFFIFTNAIDKDYFLTWDEVRVMNNSGMTIGGHTKSHPYLFEIKDPAKLRDEIIGGKKEIENQLGQKIDLFAYPYGHYNEELINIVKEAGFKSARSTYKGINNATDDLYKLKAIEATDDFQKFLKNLAS